MQQSADEQMNWSTMAIPNLLLFVLSLRLAESFVGQNRPKRSSPAPAIIFQSHSFSPLEDSSENTYGTAPKSASNCLTAYLQTTVLGPYEKAIAEKVLNEERISDSDALFLYESNNLRFLGLMAQVVRERKNGRNTYFNRNFHIEPTNICIYDCAFCSYSRTIRQQSGWKLTLDEIMDTVKKWDNEPVTEVHIVGGVIPEYDITFYEKLFRSIKRHRPDLHIKALTPVEYHYIFKKAKAGYRDGLMRLISAGLDSVPGGGAEIFHPMVRKKIAAEKCSADEWIELHRTLHQLGLKSNASMLYGHIEAYWHRVDHLSRLRDLQDETGGFQTFLPLKYRNKNNKLSYLDEATRFEDLKNYAVSRIYLDNFDHIKAYWPMIGVETTQMSLSFGVDDIDGTIDDTTKIFSMAGVADQNPAMSTRDLIKLVNQAGYKPMERDTLYNIRHNYSVEEYVSSAREDEDHTRNCTQTKTRIAVVSYLNSRPFIDGLNATFKPEELDLSLLPPAECALALEERKVDLALIPVGSVLESDELEVMKDYCIGANGKVDSVFLFSQKPLEQLETVILDRHSRTSNRLAQLLLKHYWVKEVQFIEAERKHFDEIHDKTGGVVIGDAALKLQNEYRYKYDLAEHWKLWTGLPFVFAVWAYKPGGVCANTLSRIAESQRKGVSHLSDTSKKWAPEHNLAEEKVVDYLKERISFEFDSKKKESVQLYLALLRRLDSCSD